MGSRPEPKSASAKGYVLLFTSHISTNGIKRLKSDPDSPVTEDAEQVDFPECGSGDWQGGIDCAHANKDDLSSRACTLQICGVSQDLQEEAGGNAR